MKALSQLMRQAQEMQAEYAESAGRARDIEVEGIAGGGMVKVVVTCKHEVRRVRSRTALLGDDKEMLEDLIAAAFNDANRKIEQTVQDKLSSVTGGLPCPPVSSFRSERRGRRLLAAAHPAHPGAAMPARRRDEIRAAHGFPFAR